MSEEKQGTGPLSGRQAVGVALLVLFASLFVSPWLFLVGAVGVAVYAIRAELRRLYGAVRWPTVEGFVTTSRVCSPGETRERFGRHTAGYAVDVGYEYRVDGEWYECHRLAAFDRAFARRRAAARVVERYPRGGTVRVRYDPADPSNAVLGLPDVGGVWVAIPLVLVAAVVWFVLGTPGGALVPALLAGVVLVGIPVVSLVQVVRALRTRRWAAVDGRIVSARVREHVFTDDGTRRVTYVPEVRYDYRVDATTYVSGRIRVGGAASGSRARAERVVDQYERGAVRPVYYDPTDPDSAVLEPGVRGVVDSALLGVLVVVVDAALLVYFV